jgi:hypothetical protein
VFRPASKLSTFQLAVSKRWGFFSFFVCNLTARMELGIIPVKKNYFSQINPRCELKCLVVLKHDFGKPN